MTEFDIILKEWFDRCLGLGCSYGSSGEPFTKPPIGGVLIYQDGAGSSQFYAFSDVFLMPNNTYLVQTDYGYIFNENKDELEKPIKCKDLYEVFDELVLVSYYNRNSCGDLIYKYGIESISSDFHLADLKTDEKLIEIMKKMESYSKRYHCIIQRN